MALEILKNLLHKTFEERLNYLDRRSKDQIESLHFSAKEFKLQTRQVDKIMSEYYEKRYENNALLNDNSIISRPNRTSAFVATSKDTSQRQSPYHTDKSAPKKGEARTYKALTPGRTPTEPSYTRARTPLVRKEKTEVEPKALSRGRTEKNLLAKPLKTVKVGPGKNNNNPTPLSTSKSQRTLGRGISPKAAKPGSHPTGKNGSRHSQMNEKKDLKNVMQMESNENTELQISNIEVEHVKISPIQEKDHQKRYYTEQKRDIRLELQKAPWLETICSYLTPQEKLQFFSLKKEFRPHSGKMYAIGLSKFEEKNGLFYGQTVEDKINEIKLVGHIFYNII